MAGCPSIYLLGETSAVKTSQTTAVVLSVFESRLMGPSPAGSKDEYAVKRKV